ncbi:MAG: DUF1883 domain-containing protein [Chthoniobacterales bacterium]|nr:DUF1883 domain-containing protein [Chthoniobacterales bacterium]
MSLVSGSALLAICAKIIGNFSTRIPYAVGTAGLDPLADSEVHPSRRYLNQGEIVQLDCDTQCNFMLLTDADFAAYQIVKPFRYHGGTFKRFPAQITVPDGDYWNIVIDLNGATKEVQYNITIVIG